jgi:hypothetical protein
MLLESVVGCSSTTETLRNFDFLQWKHCGFGEIASLNGVVEPQADDRLHWQINLFSRVLNPSMLTQLVSSPENLKHQVGEYIDSIVCKSMPMETY